jgi:hypothetical protein
MIFSRAMRVTYSLGVVALVTSLTMDHTASALTADLAKKCREMMIKAYPGKGHAQEQRKYYSVCIAQDGRMENSGTATEGSGK